MDQRAPETQYVKTADGLYIAYQVVGEGPDLVLIDGWVTPLEARWDQPTVADALWRLASFSRVIAFDKRGIGLSDTAPFDVSSTLEAWTEDVATVMAAAGSERATLFGHHDGGWPAMLFAAAHPESVSELVLMHATARLSRADDYRIGMPDHFGPNPEDRVRDYGTNWGGPMLQTMPDEIREWWSRSRRHQATLGAFLSLMSMQREVDLRSVLPSIHVPTLILHRAGNRFWRPAFGRYLAENIPNAAYAELPGSEHQWQFGDASALLDEIEEFLTGTRPAPTVDRVLATVLFTDVVGSTEALTAVGDRAWRQKLDAYERQVRGVIARHSGREVFTKGDEFLVSFDGPARAVRCAVAIRSGAAQLDLQVRTGIHTGEVELRGDDIAGIAVHIGARVMATAQPGEILVSRTVTDLVAGSGLEFEDRGAHALKGVDNEWQLFAVK